jgi:CRISPR-associated helicase Cas3
MTIEIDLTPLAYEQVGGDWLPNYRPYEYQWRAYQAVAETLDRKQSLCLFLITPTGSGKTLASFAHSIRHGIPALGVYPTNELIRDQERGLAPEYGRVLGWQDWVLKVDGRALDDWGLEFGEPAHAEALERLLNWRRVILTNPDILYYIAFGRYPERSDRPGQHQRLFALLGSTYRLCVFDEFHLYNIKQMASVAFLIGALQAINPEAGRLFIFASATPDLEIISYLRDCLNLPVEIIQAQAAPPGTGRVVTHPLHLLLVPADLERWRGVETLLDQSGCVDQFLACYPQARVVTILDSVAGAVRLAEAWRERYPDRPVGEVHGFTSEIQRDQALHKATTVGTSTIEVGIDFKGEAEKDLLVFEARTASQFIQRLGRIGRHGKTRDIPNWAIGLVPEYVVHTLAAMGTGPSPILSREDLYHQLEQAYRIRETFRRYLHCHAPVEFAEAKVFVQSLFQPDDRGRIVPALEENIQALTGLSPGAAMARWRDYRDKNIIWPLLTFRGAGFEVGILDKRGVDPGFPARRYDLMFLVRRGIFEEVDEKSYLNELEYLATQEVNWAGEAVRERRFGRPIGREPSDLLGVYGFFSLRGFLEKGRRVWFEMDEGQVAGLQEQITVVAGLELCSEPPVRMPGLVRRFRKKQLVAWFTDRHPTALRLGRALPPLFEVFELRIRGAGGRLRESVWSIAFGQNAFFLDSLLWRRQPAEAIVV